MHNPTILLISRDTLSTSCAWPRDQIKNDGQLPGCQASKSLHQKDASGLRLLYARSPAKPGYTRETIGTTTLPMFFTVVDGRPF